MNNTCKFSCLEFSTDKDNCLKHRKFKGIVSTVIFVLENSYSNIDRYLKGFDKLPQAFETFRGQQNHLDFCQDATQWLCEVLKVHPSRRKAFWEKCYNTMSLQTFCCHLLTLSLATSRGLDAWGSWIKMCDPNLSQWTTKESSIDTMEKMWVGFLASGPKNE